MNKCFFKGNLTRDIELRFTPNNVAVADIGLAVSERYKEKDGSRKDRTHFFDLTAWQKRAEVMNQYFVKGDPILVECHAVLDTWDDKDGNKRSKVKFVVDDFEFIKPRDPNQNKPEGQSQAPANKPVDDSDMDLPF